MPRREPKKRPHDNYKFIDYSKRVDVLYDFLVHNLTPYELTTKYSIKYNTVRDIVNNYKKYNRVNVK